MTLYNETRNKVIAPRVILANSFIKRLKGLLGKDEMAKDLCIFIDPCRSIHTFFMKFNIHVLFLDKEYRVIRLIEDMAPGKISPYIKEGAYVVEVSSQKDLSELVKLGDRLRLEASTTFRGYKK